MNAAELKKALARIMAGERATLVVSPENWEAAQAVFATLAPSLQARLNLVKNG
jgi:hypothetical protein